MKNKGDNHRTERVKIKATKEYLEAILMVSKDSDEVIATWTQFDFADYILSADGRGYEVRCTDPETGEEIYLRNFPFQVLKWIDKNLSTLQRKSRGYGTITFKIKDGAFASVQVQPAHQEAEEIDLLTNPPE
jgi:hypothetical protein